MAGNIGVLSAKVALDTVDFKQNMAAMRRELKIAKSETELASKGILGYGQSIKTGAGQLNGLTKQINLQKQSLEEYDRRYKDAIKTQGEGSIKAQQAAANYNATALEIQKLTQEHDVLSRTIEFNDSKFKKTSDSLESIGDKAEKAGSKMISVGKVWTVAGAGVAAVATIGAKAAIDYEDSFAAVTKTVDGSAKELDNLSDGLRKMSMEIPVAATDLTELAAAAGQLGIDLPNIEGFTRVIADLGVATNLAGEEGASMLAKFANIMGMDQTQFANLGSSIVELGNNFATTEADIMNMAMRLAGAGKQIGMSEADILGISAALSSVGIEAEAGGSAISKVIINMQLATEKGTGAFSELETVANNAGYSIGEVGEAVLKGGKPLKSMAGALDMNSKSLSKMYKEADKSKTSLEDFANVAGLSGEQFSQLFKEDSVEALSMFIKGLADAEEQGTSAIKMLDDMGITEVRMRDSLLRSANASEMFAGAVDSSNVAWKENVALTNEAETKYATTASQIQIAKNKINDLAVSFGQELLPAVADALEKSGPVIDWLKNMIEGFADSSPQAKKFALSLGAIAIAGGPLLTVGGGLVKGFGTLSKGLGSAISLGGKLKYGLTGIEGAANLANGGLTTLAGGMAATETSGSLLATVLGSGSAATLGGALLISAGVIAGTVLALKGLQEASENYQRSGARWGTEVTEEQDKVIQKTHELEVEALASMDQYQAGVVESADKVKVAYQGIADEAEKAAEKQSKGNQKVIDSLPDELKKDAQNEENENKKTNKNIVDGIQNRVNRVQEIMEGAYANNRKVTKEENAEIIRLTEDMNKEQLKLVGISVEEQEKILQRMGTNFATMVPKNLEKYSANMEKELDKQIGSYEKQVKGLEKIYKDNPNKLSVELEKLSLRHTDIMDRMVSDYARAKLAAGTSLEDMAFYLGKWGYSVEEAEALIAKFGDSITSTSSKVAQGTSEADNAWNSMVFDPKTGEIRDNLSEFLVDVAKTDAGWEQLKLISKEATLTTNAREEIAIAIGESGRWNELSVDEKKVIANGDEAIIAFYNAVEANNQWNDAEILIKELGVDNYESITKILESDETLKAWNKLSPELKSILVNNDDKEKIIQSDRLYSEWLKLPDSIKNINIKANTSGAEEAQRAINSVYDKNVVINVEYRGRATGQTAIHSNEKGTNFHPGGHMLVNDQAGSMYREAVKFPNSPWFIPEGRNVFIPGAPQGTKVMPAGMTAAKFKNYAEGTGFDSSMFGSIPFKRPDNIDQVSQIVVENNPAIDKLITIFSKFVSEYDLNPIIETTLNVNEKQFAKIMSPGITKEQKGLANQKLRMKGVPNVIN